MHISTLEVRKYIERNAQKTKGFDQLDQADQYSIRLSLAEVLVWDLIMDLDPDVRVKRIKEMKK